MPHRESLLGVGVFAALIGAETALLCVLVGLRWSRTLEARPSAAANRELVSHLGLTDLALWSEARYTRHPSQADLFSPFADYPSCLEHFPSGSLSPPQGVVRDVPGILRAGGRQR